MLKERYVPYRNSHVGRGPTSPGPPKNQIVTQGPNTLTHKNHPGSLSCCRILKASLTSPFKRSLRREQQHASLTTVGLHNGSNRGKRAWEKELLERSSVKTDDEAQWIFEVRHLQSS